MLDQDLKTFLESGCSTIVGVLTPNGEPYATRAWGTEVLDTDPLRLRLLLGAATLVSLGHPVGDDQPFAIALTGADVRTLRSVQVKGTARGIEVPTAADQERAARFCEAFFGAVEDVDGIPVPLMARLAPTDLLACTVEVAEMYDQTPGPGAGEPLRAPGP